jgi:hypothetical protein
VYYKPIALLEIELVVEAGLIESVGKRWHGKWWWYGCSFVEEGRFGGLLRWILSGR